jgi:hypothetical protein
VTTGWAVLASSQPRDVSSGDARLSRNAKCASVTCAPLRRRQMACCSRACPSAAAALLCHLGPLSKFAFQEIGLGLLPTAAGQRATGTPTSVTALGGILVGDSRVEAGASESWPAMSDGESGFLTNYSRSGPTIIRDYSRRPRPGSGPDRTRPHFARIKVTQMPGLRFCKCPD